MSDAILPWDDRPRDEYVIFIRWDKTHTSPPIGPYESYTQAKKEASAFRKRLRENRHKIYKIDVSTMASPMTAWGWSSLCETEEDDGEI